MQPMEVIQYNKFTDSLLRGINRGRDAYLKHVKPPYLRVKGAYTTLRTKHPHLVRLGKAAGGSAVTLGVLKLGETAWTGER